MRATPTTSSLLPLSLAALTLVAGCGGGGSSSGRASTAAAVSTAGTTATTTSSTSTQPTATGTTGGGVIALPGSTGSVTPGLTPGGTTTTTGGTTTGGTTTTTGGTTTGGTTTGGTTTGGTTTTTGGTTTGGTTTGGTTTGGTTTGGTTTTPPLPTGPDTSPPLITLVSPTRGLHTTQANVRVEGTVVDQTGVAYFIVNGVPVIPGANGAFLTVLPLVDGLNVVELEAGDPLGHRTRTALPVVSGRFTPEASPVADAVAARLNRPAFDAIERIAAQQLGGVNLAQMIMAQNPLYSGSAGIANVDVNATGASFGAPALDLDPQAGGLRVHVEIPNIDVQTRASGRVLGIPYGINVSVTATRAIVDAVAVVTVAPGGVVTTTLQNVVVSLPGFRFDIGGIPTFLENLARSAVQRLVESQVRRQVETVIPAEVNRAIAGANGPITQVVMGRTVTLHLIPRAVVFDVNGCSVLTDGDMRLPAVAGLPTTPGSLTTTGAPPTFGTTPAVHIALNDDMLNRVGHAAWRGGLIAFHLDQATAQTMGLPAWLPMDAFLLQLFFPQLAGRINPLDPIEIDVSSGTPAMFRTLPAPGLVETQLGDLTISVYVAPAGRPRQLVLRAGTQVKVGVTPSLGAGNTLQIAIAGRPTIRTDVFETPLAPLPETAIESFVDFVMPPVIQLLPRAWSGFPLPLYPGLTPRNVLFERSGAGNDFVTVKSDL